MAGFGAKHKIESIPTRRFSIEYKYRPPDDTTGEGEEVIQNKFLDIPRLRDASLEKRWVQVSVWNTLNSKESQARGINQAFVYCSDFEDLFLRLELTPFFDEPSQVLKPPSDDEYSAWKNRLRKRFKQLYGITLETWLNFHAGDTRARDNTAQSSDSSCSEATTEAIVN